MGRRGRTSATSDPPVVVRPSWRRVVGIEIDDVSAKERVVASSGGVIAILLVLVMSEHVLGLEGGAVLIGSIGASAVLLFAVPHGQLSQPWPVFGGQVLSAIVGVTCGRLIEPRELAAACAVGIAIGVMHTAKCVHPPGGATALAAVTSGPAVTELGYGFVIRPVLVNTVTILVVAVAYNAFFVWRRYPAALVPPSDAVRRATGPTHDQVREAMREIESFVDVTEEDLLRLHDLLTRAEQRTAHSAGPSSGPIEGREG